MSVQSETPKKGLSRRKKVAIIGLIILIFPSTFFGLLYYQISNLQVSVSFEETQVVSWFSAIITGKTPELVVTLTFTNPTFLQVDVTDIYVQLYIEDEYALETSIEQLFIPPGKTVDKDISFSISDAAQILLMVSQASEAHGGEVKVTLTGHATVHLLFMGVRLPFSVDRYFMTEEPALQYGSSKWVDADGNTVSACLVYDQVYVQVSVENPTRKQTITGSVKIVIYRDITLWPDEKVKEESQSVSLNPGESETVSLDFTPNQESGYHFTVLIDDKKPYTQPNTFPPRLRVSKSATSLTLDEPSSSVSAGSTVTFTGKLVNAETAEGVSGATIKIYDRDLGDPTGDDFLGVSGTTGSDGSFSIEWVAKKMDWWDSTAEVYAKFEGDDSYESSTSSQYTITVS